MNLVELVPHLKNRTLAEELLKREWPELVYEFVNIYMKDKLGLESTIVFFDTDKISGQLIIEIDGIQYESLFTLNMTQELVEEYYMESDQKLSDLEIAERLIDYCINDA